MATKNTVWVGKWPDRARDLAVSLGLVNAAQALSIDLGRTVTAGAVRQMLDERFKGWRTAPRPDVPADAASAESILRDRCADLEKQVETLRRETLTDDRALREIRRVASAPEGSPDWVLRARKTGASSPGVPTLFVSDEHWGEVVDPTQIGGVNHYDLDEARARLKALAENSLDLLFSHVVNPKYPGIVVPLGGDGTTGDIHEELTATNDDEIMPCVLDLRDHRVKFFDTLLDNFENVLVPCVTGNHGRATLKIRAKGRAHTSFDWLGYQLLARHYEKNKRIRFLIPNGPDCLFEIFSTRYLLSHGDQFRGGDGMVGALGPIIRGDHKKRSRNQATERPYDVLLLGHWHQYRNLGRLIVNGSLKGYDEYADAGNFPFERPRQALWLTHPEHGPTISMPVFCDRKAKGDKPASAWCSWAEAQS